MIRAKQIAIEVKNILMRPLYQLRMWLPFWKVLNRRSRRLFFASPTHLSPVQQRLVEELQRTGIAITHLEDLFPGQPFLADMRASAERLRPHAQPSTKKTFLTQLLERFPVLTLQDPFVRFALSDEVLGAVNGYLELWSKLYYYTLNITSPVPVGEEARQSQRWHRDPEDRKMCKVFIYLNDVGKEAGPFQYVRGSIRGGRWGRIFGQRPPHGFYPPEGALERIVPPSEVQMCTGRAGTVVFADTSGLHRGGYATGAERMMSTIGFVSEASPRGVFFRLPSDSSFFASLSPRAAFAVRGKIFGKGLGY